MNMLTTVTVAAPLVPRLLPSKPAITAPNKGSQTMVRYIGGIRILFETPPLKDLGGEG
jgi:hypothetical protein